MKNGSLNNNWRGGISKQKGLCTFCSKEYITKSYRTTKYCSRLCQNRYQAKESHIRSLMRKTTSSKKLIDSKKKYLCNKCGVDITKGKLYCFNCSPRNEKNSKRDYVCKYCKKTFTSYINRQRSFCNKNCKYKFYQGDGNPHYIDGRKPINKRFRDSKEYKEWRSFIFKRDQYKCVFCNQKGGDLNVDHIYPFALFPEYRLSYFNGRTLCKNCHEKTPTYRCHIKRDTFLEEIRKRGGYAIVAHSLDDVIDAGL